MEVTTPLSTATVDVNQEKSSSSDVPSKDISANSFSFTLKNVSDHIPQGRLPRPDIHVLELATDVEQDDMQVLQMEQTQPENTNSHVPFSVAAVSVSSFVEHVEVHDDLASTDLVSAREESPLLVQHFSQEEVCIDHTIEGIRPSGSSPTLAHQQNDLANSANIAHLDYEGVHSEEQQLVAREDAAHSDISMANL